MKQSEEYTRLAKGNLANLLEFFYKKGEHVPLGLAEKLDFSEEIEKIIVLDTKGRGYDRSETIRENHAINCVRHLEFEVYSRYMNSSWIYDNGTKFDNSLVRTCLWANKIKPLEKSLDLVAEDVKKITEKDLADRKIENNFFSPILDLSLILRYSEEQKRTEKEILDFYNLFKKSLNLFEVYYNKKSLMWHGKNQSFDSWHKDYNKLKVFFSSNFHDRKHLDELLVGNKKFFKIFKDIDAQYANNETFVNEDLLEKALEKENFPLITHLIKNQKINEEELNIAYKSFIKNEIKLFKNSIEESYYDKILETKFKVISKKDDLFIKNNLKIEESKERVEFLLACNDESSQKELLKIKNVIEIKVGELSIKEMSWAADLINNVTKERMQKKIDSVDGSISDSISEDIINRKVDFVVLKNEKEFFKEQYKCFGNYMCQMAKNFTNNNIAYELSLDEKNKVASILLENSYNYFNFQNNKLLQTLVNKYIIEDHLEKNEIKQKKNKI